MSTKRNLGSALETSLMNGDPFLYAHLIKFERSITTVSGKPSESATDYSYITDGSFDLVFNDNSTDVEGTSNGNQTYVANKLKTVSNVTETTEAKASTLNISIAAESLNTQTYPNQVLIWATSTSTTANISTASTEEDFVEVGFSEGDKLTIKRSYTGANAATPAAAAADTTHNQQFVINSFSNNNRTMSVTLLDTLSTGKKNDGSANDTLTNTGSNNGNYILELTTDEVASLFNIDYDQSNGKYAGYVNREVFIYKAHINPDSGAIIGAPYLLFKGIISKVNMKEDPNKSSVVTWTLSSHWGDWNRVQGRITSDSEHRAIGAGGRVDTSSLHREKYGSDLGFQHSETSVNIIAIYQVQETRYKMKSSGFFGMKKKLKKYTVEVDRDVDLRLNLEAKYLPVIYGVQRTDSIPVFADSLTNDAATIHVVYAICEGEIAGMYDMYIDDQSRICINKNDSDTRSSQTGSETIDVVCEGRMDRGDTLSSVPASANIAGPHMLAAIFEGIARGGGNMFFSAASARAMQQAYLSNFSINDDNGVTHEEATSFQFPIQASGILHTGKPNQRPDDRLVRIASESGFKLQQDFDKGDEYWNSQSKMLDTAYFAVQYKVDDGDVSIPSIDFVVRGREISQYNYDYSYQSVPEVQGYSGYVEATERAKFSMGDKVKFFDGSNNALVANVTIEDIYKYKNAAKETIYKFRFDQDPLPSASVVTEFFMIPQAFAGSDNTQSSARYVFQTWDHRATAGRVPSPFTETVNKSAADNTTATVSNMDNADSSKGMKVKFSNTDIIAALDHINKFGITISFLGVTVNIGAIDLSLPFFQPLYNTTTKEAEDISNSAVTDLPDSNLTVLVPNAIKLQSTTIAGVGPAVGGPGTGTTFDDYYKGQTIELTRKLSTGDLIKSLNTIIGYDGETRVAFVGDIAKGQKATTPRTGKTTVGAINTTFLILNDVSSIALGDIIVPKSTGSQRIGDDVTVLAINTGTKTLTLSKSIYSANINNIPQAIDIQGLNAGTEDILTPGTIDRFIPNTGDTYRIFGSLGDKKVSINPAMQLLDYMTNTRFGRGLDLDKDINLHAFKEAARLCDTRSNVSVVSVVNAIVGGIYKFTDAGGKLRFQGTVVSSTYVTIAGAARYQIVFTNCIGKLVNKFLDWGNLTPNELAWNRDNATNITKLYKVPALAANGTYALSNSSEISSVSLTRVDAGGAALTLHIMQGTSTDNSTSCAFDGNPVVKTFDTVTGSFGGGYSLYDSDDVKFWRYMGWQEQNQREVTRHQTNATIRTENPIFDNVNSMLEHFNGILRFNAGKYELDVESSVSTYSSDDPRDIVEADIIGSISVEDAGVKGSANSVSVSVPDPQIRFDKRNVTFFDSKYLKQDRGVPKKKSIKTPLITNYYNARINAEQYLVQSRSSKKISFRMGPKGNLLLAGTIIRLSYERFGWENKYFRISNLSFSADCLVTVTAMEHDDDSYIVSGKDKTFDAASQVGGPGPTVELPDSPLALAATTAALGAINLTWANSAQFGVAQAGAGNFGWSTEILYNSGNSRASGTPRTLATLQGDIDEFKHVLVDATASSTHYYWVRHKKTQTLKSGKITTLASEWFPTGNGIQGNALILSAGGGIIYLYKNAATEPTDDPSADTLFPTVVVATSGSNAGKITGVASSGQGDAALTSNQVIDTAGNATGWYTIPQTPPAGQFIWIIAATANSNAASDPILRAEWTEPAKFSGADGQSYGVVELFRTINTESGGSAVAPALPSADLTWNFDQQTLTGGSLDNWSLTETPVTANNKYLWKTTSAVLAARASSGDTTTVIEGTAGGDADWSGARNFHTFAGPGLPGSSSKVVKLTASQYVIPYTTVNTEATTLTFTAAPQNVVGTATYQFFVNNAIKQNTSSTTTYQMADADEPANGIQKVVRVDLYDDNVLVATDSVSVYGIKDGTDALTVILSNSSHVVPAANNGSVTSAQLAGSGTDIRVFRGSTALQYGSGVSKFLVNVSGSSAPNQISPGAISTVTFTSTNDTARVAAATAMGGNSATVTFSIVVRDAAFVATTIVKQQSLAKAKEGAVSTVAGPEGKKTIQGYLYQKKTASVGTPPGKPSGTSIYHFTGSNEGTVTGTDIQEQTADKWSNTPMDHDVSSPHTHWTVRYFGEQATSLATTISLSSGNFSNVVKHTSFSGVVTFIGGTFAVGGVNTTIDGGVITTGSVASPSFASSGGGTKLVLATGSLNASDPIFEVKNSSNASKFKITKAGDITANNFDLVSGNISGTVTIGGVSGNYPAANNSAKSAGSVGGWTISSTQILGGNSTSHVKLEASASKKRIVIRDSNVDRVIIGDLS